MNRTGTTLKELVFYESLPVALEERNRNMFRKDSKVLTAGNQVISQLHNTKGCLLMKSGYGFCWAPNEDVAFNEEDNSKGQSDLINALSGCGAGDCESPSDEPVGEPIPDSPVPPKAYTPAPAVQKAACKSTVKSSPGIVRKYNAKIFWSIE